MTKAKLTAAILAAAAGGGAYLAATGGAEYVRPDGRPSGAPRKSPLRALQRMAAALLSGHFCVLPQRQATPRAQRWLRYLAASGAGFSRRLLPATMSKRKKRHSSGPLKSTTLREGLRCICAGRVLSDESIQAHQPA